MLHPPTIVAALLAGTCLALGPIETVCGQEKPNRSGPAFTDITKESGVAQIVADKYAADPKWWHSGLHLVDLDGDGKLDLFLSSHGSGRAVALMNDGKGRFTLASGEYPASEIHLAYDADEDGLVDLTMTFQDGGGKWWMNRSKPEMLKFDGTRIERGTNTARRQAMIDLDRDGKVDWLRILPVSLFVFESCREYASTVTDCRPPQTTAISSAFSIEPLLLGNQCPATRRHCRS